MLQLPRLSDDFVQPHDDPVPVHDSRRTVIPFDFCWQQTVVGEGSAYLTCDAV